MLEHIFVRTGVVARLRRGPLGLYLDDLATYLHQQGYAPSSMQSYLRTGDTFGRWLDHQGYAISQLDDALVQRYVSELKRYRSGHLPKAAEGLNQLLKFLQRQGVMGQRQAITPVSPADQWLLAYDTYLAQVIGLAVGTRQCYQRVVRRFMTACFGSEVPDWQGLTASMISTFVTQEAARRQRTGRKTPSVVVRSFLRFLVFRGEIRAGLEAAAPTPPQWTHAALPSRLTPEEVEQVLATPQDGTARSRRNHAMLLLLARLGLRAQEVVVLRLDDIDWAEGRLHIRAGKTHRARSLPLPQDVGQGLVAYLQDGRPQRNHRQIFLQCHPPFRPLTRSAIWSVVQQAFERAGIAPRPRRGSHIFRHTVASQLVNQGASFKEVADLLTVLIDLERRQPVALLPDRTADTVAQWLRAHPGVEVIARDRSQAYAEGARQGAPAATQVADRFHLLQNLREALDQVFITHGHVLDTVNETMRQQPVSLPDGMVAVPVPPHDIPLPAQQRAAQRQAHRQALHTQVWTLHRQGWTAPAIAQQVGLSLRTVQRDLRTATFAGRKRRSDLGDSMLNPYKPYLLERWNAGCYTAMRLFRDLQQRGYRGSYGPVAAYARRLRQAQGLAPGQRRPRQSLPHVAEPVCQPLTPRRASWLVLRRESKRTEAEVQQLARLRTQHAEVAAAIDLAQDFATLVRRRQPAQLDPWLKRATTSTLEALQRFAAGLYEDYEAVKAGVTLPWSSGPVEGHINRLKMLKRQMFGRARLDLLSRRFVRGPRRGHQEAQCVQEASAPHSEAATA